MATKTKRATVKKTTEAPATPAVEKKPRKAYPSREERVNMANKTIDRLSKLNARREKLIEKTEKTLEQRKAALAKSSADLERALARKARLENPAPKGAKRKTGTRAAKGAEKEKIQQLQSLLDQSGKTLDDLLSELKN